MKRTLLSLGLTSIMLPALAQGVPSPAPGPAKPSVASPSAATAAPSQSLPTQGAAEKRQVPPAPNPTAAQPPAAPPAAQPSAVAAKPQVAAPAAAPSATPASAPAPTTCAPCAETQAAPSPKKKAKKKKAPLAAPVAKAPDELEEKLPTPYEAALAARQARQAIRDQQEKESAWTPTANMGCRFLEPIYAQSIAAGQAEYQFGLPPTGTWKPARLTTTVDWVNVALDGDTLVIAVEANPKTTRRVGEIALETAGLHCVVPVLQAGSPEVPQD